MPFAPRIDHDALTPLLDSLEEARQEIHALEVPPMLARWLTRSTEARGAHMSTRIEGNPMTEEEVREAFARPERGTDEHELESGRRQEGVFFGAVAFSGKAASGLGTIFAGVALDLISWPRGEQIQTAADIAPETIASLGMIYGPIVSGFAVVSVWCYTHYRLNRTTHQAILAKLAITRAERQRSPAPAPLSQAGGS